MTVEKIRLRHAEHCGWMVFTERTVNCFGREADARIPGLQALGYALRPAGLQQLVRQPRRQAPEAASSAQHKPAA